MASSMTSAKRVAPLEALDRSRRQMLTMIVVTSCLWFLPQILRDIWSNPLPQGLTTVLILAGMAGGIAWMFSMWRYHRFQQKVQADPKLLAQLDDERVISMRKDAMLRSWGILLVCLAIGVALAPFVEFPDTATLMILLLVGVNAPIVIFLVLDRD